MDLLPFFLLDDDDLLMYWADQNLSNRKYHIQTKSTGDFKLDDLTDDYCWLHFRFYKAELVRLCCALGLPAWIRCRKNITVSGIEALCILLKRLAYPNRYVDIMKFFPRASCELSRIFNRTLSIDIRLHGHRLRNLNQNWLTLAKVSELAEVLVNRGCPYKECFGFLDGTVRPVCRPKYNQKQYYNGHKRVHAIKFQSVLVPNGLVLHLSGPVVGRRHDGYLLQSSRILTQMEARFFTPRGRPYHLYGDPAYPLHPHLITPFKAHTITPAKKKCNKVMSSMRESVEWGFNKVLQLFAFLDYKNI